METENSSQEKNVKIQIEFDGFKPQKREIEVSADINYSQMLEDMGINPETAVVLKDGLPVPSDETVEKGSIRVIRVISGG
ncbi:MAG: hypothetical protein ACOC5L_02600 [Halobacteriota archaeon]